MTTSRLLRHLPPRVRGDERCVLLLRMTDGVFERHRGHWDANRDGTITTAEFDADPREFPGRGRLVRRGPTRRVP